MVDKITHKISYIVASIVLMTAQMTPFFVFAPKAGADGNGSSVECLDTTPNVAGSITGTKDVVVYNAGTGYVIDGVCIKSGQGMFDGEKHSGVLSNGTYEDSCYTVTGVGTQTVTVTRIGDGPDCKDISHIDAVVKPIKGSIKVIKDAQPNSTDDFKFTVKKGGSTVDTFELEDDGDNNDGQKDNKTINDLAAGTYVVTESPEKSGWVLHDIVCSGGANITKDVADKKVTIALVANENVICTFVNKPAPQYGEVKVNKWTDINGDGDYKDSKEKDNPNANSLGFLWGLDVEAVDNLMGTTQPNVSTGQHTVNENSISGYELVGWHRSGDNKDCDRNLPVIVDVKKNEKTEITLCNKKIPKGTLVLIKEVKNDNGGTAVQNAWTLNANGPEAVSGIDNTASTDTGYSKDVAPGVYVLSETNGPAGYELDSVKCKIDNGNRSTLGSKKEIEVKSGKTTKCVFKNDDKAPSLSLVKQVVNSDKPATSWNLSAQGASQNNPTNLSGNGSATSGSNFKADTYTLGETGPSGFNASPWTCTNEVIVNGDNQITLGLGQTTTCTIINTAKPVTIVATKIVCDNESLLPNYGTSGPDITTITAIDWVTNNSGCKLAEGWNFEYAFNDAVNPGDNQEVGGAGWTVFGPTNSNGQTSTEISDLSNVNRIWVREQLKDGYLGFSYNIAGNNNNAVSAELYCNEDVLNYDNYDFIDNPTIGNTYYCVAWNVQQAPSLTVIKEVINDNGGTAKISDFKLKKNGLSLTFGEGVVNGYKTTYTSTPVVKANKNYTLSEIDLFGYTEGTWSCSDGSQGPGLTVTVNLAPGEDVTCTITNNDKPGKIVVHKKVINDNGGTKKAKDFKYKVNRGNWKNFNHSGVNFETVNAGTYSISEKSDSGYEAAYKGCKNVIVKNGEVKHCYITNNDKKSYVFIDKSTYPYNDTQQFFFNVINNGVNQGTLGFTSDLRGQTAIKPGLVTVEEPEDKIPSGWFNSYKNCWKTTVVYKQNGAIDYFIDGKSVGTSFTAVLGQNYRCEFVNEKAGKVIVTKINDVNNNGVRDEGEEALQGWDMVLTPEGEDSSTETTNNAGQAVFESVKPGEFNFEEVNQEGWTQTFKYCDYEDERGSELSFSRVQVENDTEDSFWVYPGGTVNCYIGNYTPTMVTDIQPICVNNFPYLRWNVKANGFTPTQFTLRWFTVAGNEAGTPAGTLVDTQIFTPSSSNVTYDSATNTYSATTLWPGADDNPLDQDWPGWTLVNGLWVKDPSDFGGNLRANASVTLSVNPTQQANVAYPSTSSSPCGPSNPAVLGATTTKLESTGSNQNVAMVVGISLAVLAMITTLNSKKFRKNQ